MASATEKSMNVTLTLDLGVGRRKQGRNGVKSEDVELGNVTSEDRARAVRSPP